MIKIKSLIKINESVDKLHNPELENFIKSNYVVPFSDWVYHGTPLEGLKSMLTEGIWGTQHGEIAEYETLSTSLNSEVLDLFSEHEGTTGLSFKVQNIKLLVLNDILHKLLTVLPGSGMDVDVDENEYETFCKKYNIPDICYRHEPYLPYNYISSLGVNAFTFDYVYKKIQTGYNLTGGHDEYEICFVGKGISLLNTCIDTIYVDGDEFDVSNKIEALRAIEGKI